MLRQLNFFLNRVTSILRLKQLLRVLKAPQFFDFFLKIFPIRKTTKNNSIHYRLRSYASIALEHEIFQSQSYRSILQKQKIQSFVDLGCNIGLFACYLADVTNNKALKGLLIDANPAVVKEALWHIKINRFTEMHLFNGAVGVDPQKKTVDFYVSHFNVISTLIPSLNKDISSLHRIEVPCLQLKELWEKEFGSLKCDLLKIDIEGAELEFLKNEKTFLKNVESIILEWHKPQIVFQELSNILSECGFQHWQIEDENDSTGVAFFARN